MRAVDKLEQASEHDERAGGMSVGPVDDHFEREANDNAQRVAGDSEGQTNAPSGNRLQRKEAGAGAQGGSVSPEFAQSVASARGRGSALPSGTLQQMNHGFGADFSSVRVHSDAQSDTLNRSISAHAFTSGSDIFFRPNAYDPGSKQGQQTLAHELTHVVQQGGARQGVQRRADLTQIQRLISAQAFKKDTKLSFGRKGKSKDFFATVVDMLNEYHSTIAGKAAQARITFLNGIITFIQPWLDNRGAKSSRRSDVVDLRNEVRDEIYRINQSLVDLQGNDFTDQNVSEANDNAVGDSMNRLDELTYNFGVEEMDDGTNKKNTEGTFKGYFKKDVAKDLAFGRHRGSGAGIPENNPEFGKRNLAMQAIDKLLDAKVIPPTFSAQHNNQQGIVMKKVEGVTGKKALKDDEDMDDNQKLHNNPKVRQGLSKLYLLDVICAQVDRHPGNYIIEIEDGVIKGVQGIDNDLAFGKDLDFNTMEAMKGFNKNFGVMLGKEASTLTEIDRPFAERIVALALNHQLVSDALNGLVSGQEIQATLDRLDALSNFLQPLLNNNDGRLKTVWED